MKEKVLTWVLNREDWDGWVGRPLTDEEWETVCDEISGRLDNFADGLTEDLVKDIQSDRLISKFDFGKEG